MRKVLSLHNWINSLPPDIQAEILQQMRPRDYADGAAVYGLGEEGHELYLIESGRVSICNYSEAGREVLLAELRAGDCFGEMSLIDGLPRANNAYCVGVCKLLVLHEPDFQQLYTEHPPIASQLNRFLSRRLRMSYIMAQDASVLTLKDRLSRLLSRLGYSTGVTDEQGATVIAGASHEHLARMLGATRQSVSRELKVMEKAGLLHCSYGRILIPDIVALVSNCDNLIGGEAIVPGYDPA